MADDSSTRRVAEERHVAVEDSTPRVERNQPTDGTRRVFGEQPMPPPSKVAVLGFLQPGHKLLDRFEVIETLHPHETERPGIFVCNDGERKVVVKIAPLQYPPKPELWVKLPELDHPNVLKVFETLESGGLYFEIQEYCEGGSLKDWLKNQTFPTEWVVSHFVAQANNGLRYLHDQGIVHRDIKPANIYMRQRNLKSSIVLGDFDISSILTSDRTSRDTGRNAGTWAYMPPEAYPRFIDSTTSGKAARVTRSADYYSLGITMIELILGTTSLHASDLPDLFDFYLSGSQIELPTKPPELVRLLRGLLVRERHKRWAADQVDRWLEQKNTYEDAQAILDDEYFSLRRAVTPYSIGYMHATDLVSLADILERHPDETIDDYLKSDRLINWVSEIDMNVARALDRDRNVWRSETENCLYRCVMIIDRTRPFNVIGIGKARTKQEWLRLIADSDKAIEEIAAGPGSFPEVRKLDAWLHLKPDAEASVGDRVGITLWQPALVRLEEIIYIFDPTIPYSHSRNALETLRTPETKREGARTPQEIVEQAYGPPEGWKSGIPDCYSKAFDRWKGGYLSAWMRQHGLAALAASAQEAADILKDHPFAAFEAFLRKLHPPKHSLQVTFEAMDYAGVVTVPYGHTRTARLRYKVTGVGMPFSSLALEFGHAQLSAEPMYIEKRSGIVNVTVDATPRTPVTDTPYIATLNVTGGNCQLEGNRPVIRYRVLAATHLAATNMIGGALVGMLVLTLARLSVGLVATHEPVALNLRAGDAMNDAVRWSGWSGAFIFGFFLTCGFLYAGYRLWLEFLKRSQL